MKLFRVYTEDKNYDTVIKPIIEAGLDACTVYRGQTGYWKGTSEPSLLLEVYTDDDKLILALAERIKYHNKQQAVLVTSQNVEVEIV